MSHRSWESGASAQQAAWLPPPAYRTGVEAVGVLAATSTVAIQAGVSSSAAPTVTLISRQAGAGDHCPHLAAVGMLTAATMPLLAQVCHWGARKKWLSQVLGLVQGILPASHGLPVHTRPSPSYPRLHSQLLPRRHTAWGAHGGVHTGCNSVPGTIPYDQVSSCPPNHCVSQPPLGPLPECTARVCTHM